MRNKEEKLITKKIDIWSSAVKSKSNLGRGSSRKLELYGIFKMRDLILELACKGLLVKAEKCSVVELNEVAEIIMGQAPAGKDCNVLGEGTVFVKTGQFGALYPEKNEWTTNPLKFAKRGDVLICVVGATIGKLNLGIDCAIGRSVSAIRPHIGLNSKYLYYSLLPYTLKLRRRSRGSAQGVIGKSELNSITIRFPHIKEQNLIVEKVEELMRLCDQLEHKQESKIETHNNLVTSLLDALCLSINNSTQFACNWKSIQEKFDILFTTENSIDKLKQTILKLAVMGKLVSQDYKDESAFELVKKGLEEKSMLIKKGKVKKDKSLKPINIKQIPFDIPQSWQWTRLSDVSFFQEGPGILAKDFRESGTPLIRISGMHNNSVSLNGCNFLDKEMVEKKWSHFKLDFDDIVLSSSASLGKVSVVTQETVGCIVYTGLIRFKTYLSLSKGYLIKFFKSEEFARQINNSKTGAAIKHFGPTHLKGMLIPIPPIAEQRRIVAKVDELFSLCDQLKSSLAEAQTTQINLADSLAKQAIK